MIVDMSLQLINMFCLFFAFWEMLHAFLLPAEFKLFQNSIFQKNAFNNSIRATKSFDLDQAQCFVGSYLGPNG